MIRNLCGQWWFKTLTYFWIVHTWSWMLNLLLYCILMFNHCGTWAASILWGDTYENSWKLVYWPRHMTLLTIDVSVSEVLLLASFGLSGWFIQSFGGKSFEFKSEHDFSWVCLLLFFCFLQILFLSCFMKSVNHHCKTNTAIRTFSTHYKNMTMVSVEWDT